MRHKLLDQLHDVAVVGVGPVQLQHGELGIVTGGDPLVAEHPGNLIHPLQPAYYQPFQVQLGSDPQEQLHVQRVVMGAERPGQRAAGHRVEYRGLHLDKRPILQPPPGERHHLRAEPEGLTGLLGHPQVHIALAEPDVGVRQPVPLVGEAPLSLGQQLPVLYLDRQLPFPGLHHLAAHAHPVAQGKSAEPVVVGGDLGRGEQLDAPGGVLQSGERQFALHPPQHDPPGHRHRLAGLSAGLDFAVALLALGGGCGGLEPVGAAHRPAYWLRPWTSHRPWRVR